MVLAWTLLTIAGSQIVIDEVLEALFSENGMAFFIPSISVIVAMPFFGWLADAKLGNYKVVKIGITVSWLASVLMGLFSLLNYNTSLGSDQNVAVRAVSLALISLFQWTGTAIVFLNSLQLSLEQMPDASAENITSLIAWFVLTISTGFWVGGTIMGLVFACVPYNQSDLYQTVTLFPVICASINFISFHFTSPTWLIIEPKSPQSLKNIYRVLKFAAKHKAPLNRSALTYWEEAIPSRLDLGKSRYGGPFTTEQVEDVKTFFRILTIGVAIFLIEFALAVHIPVEYMLIPNIRLGLCAGNGLVLFTLNPFWCGMLTVLAHELLVYPCFKHRLPSSIKRISIISFAVMLRNIIFLTVSILEYFNVVENSLPWMLGISSVLHGVLGAILIMACFEFICAQAPYNMRGLLNGYILMVIWLSVVPGRAFAQIISKYCLTPTCSLVNASVGAVVSILAFLLYLIIARWYKTRVRDDIDTPHQWVEEVYDRYLTAAMNN